ISIRPRLPFQLVAATPLTATSKVPKARQVRVDGTSATAATGSADGTPLGGAACSGSAGAGALGSTGVRPSSAVSRSAAQRGGQGRDDDSRGAIVSLGRR